MKILVCAVIMLILMLPLVMSANADVITAEDYYKAATDNMVSWQWLPAVALKYADEGVALYPACKSTAWLYYRGAEACYQLNDYEGALSRIANAEKYVDPSEKDTLYGWTNKLKAQVYEKLQKPKLAVIAYIKAINCAITCKNSDMLDKSLSLLCDHVYPACKDKPIAEWAESLDISFDNTNYPVILAAMAQSDEAYHPGSKKSLEYLNELSSEYPGFLAAMACNLYARQISINMSKHLRSADASSDAVTYLRKIKDLTDSRDLRFDANNDILSIARDLPTADEAVQDLIDVYLTTNAEQRSARLYALIGDAYRGTSRPMTAWSYYRDALKCPKDEWVRHSVATLFSISFKDLKDYSAALEYANILQTDTDLKYKYFGTICCVRALSELHRCDEAHAMLETLQPLARQIMSQIGPSQEGATIKDYEEMYGENAVKHLYNTLYTNISLSERDNDKSSGGVKCVQ